MTFQDAAKKTQTQPKKLFIDVYTNWCGWCKRMDATTFEDPAIVAYMNKNFYAVKFDAETRDTIRVKDKSFTYKPEYKANEFAAQMLNGSMSYPTSVYVDENLNEIGPVPGYLTSEQLLPVLKYFAEDIYKTKKWEDYLNEVNKH
jgi:thioredoxin-related protein